MKAHPALLLAPLIAACAMPSPSRDPSVAEQLRAMAREAPVVVAHRGNSSSHPENTLPAFDASVRCGAGMVEFDVRQTRDGIWVCLHDETLGRTTDAATKLGSQDVRIDNVDAASLAQLDAGSWKSKAFRGTRIPTLAEGLAVIQSGSLAMIEHKSGDAAAMATELRRLGLEHEVLVQSFDWEFLRELHRLAPELALGALGPNEEAPKLDTSALELAAELEPVTMHWWASDVTPSHVALVHRAGYLLCTYTTDDAGELSSQVAMGVDMITTNVPTQLIKALADGSMGRTATDQ